MAFIASGPIKMLQVRLKCLLLPVVSLFSERDTGFLGEWIMFMTAIDLLISENVHKASGLPYIFPAENICKSPVYLSEGQLSDGSSIV
jgi:hypothetical protein